jgi:PAS domain S-box-containing protein
MKTPLHVLIVDDSEDDARLLVRELTLGGYHVTSRRVDTGETLARALSAAWQVVLCDFTMPRFSGEEALRLVKVSGLDLPFIYVSGTIGEETAVEAMVAGASDYVMKDRLARLVPAVERAVRDAEERGRAEHGLQRRARVNDALFSQTLMSLLIVDREHRIVQVNESFARYYGRTPDSFAGRSVLEVEWADLGADDARAILDEVVRTKAPVRLTSQRGLAPEKHDEGRTYREATLQPLLDERGEVEFLLFSAIDLTEPSRR